MGFALKFRLRKESHVALAYFGEGAASRGDVHEAMNFAGIHKLPLIFVCENNHYAYSTPIELQMAIPNVADRAAAYGFKGLICDGNDLSAVIEAMAVALKRARSGEGPTLIECKTYRISGHSEHDAAKYRNKAEIEEWQKKDPVLRWEAVLEKRGQNLAKLRPEIEAETQRIVADAVTFAEADADPQASEALEDLYA